MIGTSAEWAEEHSCNLFQELIQRVNYTALWSRIWNRVIFFYLHKTVTYTVIFCMLIKSLRISCLRLKFSSQYTSELSERKKAVLQGTTRPGPHPKPNLDKPVGRYARDTAGHLWEISKNADLPKVSLWSSQSSSKKFFFSEHLLSNISSFAGSQLHGLILSLHYSLRFHVIPVSCVDSISVFLLPFIKML